MIRVFQVKCENESQIPAALCRKLNIPAKDLLSWNIRRKSVDARKQKVFFSYTVDACVRNEKRMLKKKDVHPAPDETFRFVPKGEKPLENRPVVCGFGPAGMFAALLLAQYGYRPLVLERGSSIEKRQKDVETFWKEGRLNPSSNVQFGEGGAGAFSDGKLTTRSKDPLGRKVLEELVAAGADTDILIEQHPHIGTDAFVNIIKNIREEICRLGGSVMFDTCLSDLEIENGWLKKIQVNDKIWIPAQALILAAGHSARDVYELLLQHAADLEAKPFAVGVRIEHLQDFINQAMLREAAHDPQLTPARYQLTAKTGGGKGVYTFCMCPGGYVIPSASEEGLLVVNGMSYAARDGKNANAALLVQVDASDTGPGVLAGLKYQEELERKAFELSGSWKAPVQLAEDYLQKTVSTAFKGVEPTYAQQTVFADLHALFPDPVARALEEGLEQFEKAVPGFVSSGAVLTGVETRSSSAVKIARDKTTRMSNLSGIFPAGEGSGYAGGIMTSAIDGLHAAMALMDLFEKPASE